MTPKEFVLKAIEGGWDNKYLWFTMEEDPQIVAATSHDMAMVLLDPLAWKAVGNTEGWYAGQHMEKAEDMAYAIFREGKTIEEYLETL